jgi:hypothetical protein
MHRSAKQRLESTPVAVRRRHSIAFSS